MNELALFAGAGGGILGGQLLGWRTVCGVERDAYAAAVLAQRQNDGLLDPFPIWSDVSTFNGYPWQGIVEVVSGGFPCQDISVAGKGKGLTGHRSGLWKEFVRIVREIQPRYVFVENSPALTSRGIDVVLGDLAALGFDAEWGVLGASDVGAPHKRLRIWIVANADSPRQLQPERRDEEQRKRPCHFCLDVSNANQEGPQGRGQLDKATKEREAEERIGQNFAGLSGTRWWETEPNVGRVAHGVSSRVDRLTAIGNGQVPLCAAEAFKRLIARLEA